MDLELMPVLFRWLHVGAAIVTIGGMFFMRAVLMPSAEAALSDEAHSALRDKILARWKKVVYASIGLLIVSGGYNYWRVISLSLHKGQALYHALAGTKILLALLVFVLAMGLVGRSDAFAALRKNRKKWTTITLAVGVLVVLLGGVLRNLPVVTAP